MYIEAVISAAEPSAADLDVLRRLYIDTTGEDHPWALGLVHEIAGHVCLDDQSAAAILASGLGHDITMQLADLEMFVDEVRTVCP